MIEEFLTSLKEVGIKGNPRVYPDDIQYKNPYSGQELKIHFSEDKKMISYSNGEYSGIFPYSLDIDNWPEQFIELLDLATRII